MIGDIVQVTERSERYFRRLSSSPRTVFFLAEEVVRGGDINEDIDGIPVDLSER